MSFDRTLFAWHRKLMKGELAGRLIAELDLDLELAQFYALTAIVRIQGGLGGKPREHATIGLLAEEMNLHPSRASRIATDLIARGYLVREAAQDDGRKTVLVLTEKAASALARVRERKWAKMADIFAGWSDEEIGTLSRLFARYAESVGRI